MAIRGIASAIGVLVLVFGLIHAAPAAVDEEVNDTENSSKDDFAESVTEITAEIGTWIPWLAGLGVMIVMMRAVT
jgi:isopentenyldiphosphate isomerase